MATSNREESVARALAAVGAQVDEVDVDATQRLKHCWRLLYAGGRDAS